MKALIVVAAVVSAASAPAAVGDVVFEKVGSIIAPLGSESSLNESYLFPSDRFNEVSTKAFGPKSSGSVNQYLKTYLYELTTSSAAVFTAINSNGRLSWNYYFGYDENGPTGYHGGNDADRFLDTDSFPKAVNRGADGFYHYRLVETVYPDYFGDCRRYFQYNFCGIGPFAEVHWSSGFLYSAQFSTGSAVDYRIKVTAIPEPAAWAMLIGGFGLLGAAVRKRRVSAFA
jgi:hypothetical protein